MITVKVQVVREGWWNPASGSSAKRDGPDMLGALPVDLTAACGTPAIVRVRFG